MEEAINKWIAALREVDTIFRRAVEANSDEIVDANTAQLEIGKDAMGNFLDDYALDSYAQFKKSIGSQAPFGIPNLYLEGDFYSGFVLKEEGGTFFITSTDEKKDRLKTKYGDDIFGLSKESIKELRPMVVDAFVSEFRKRL